MEFPVGLRQARHGAGSRKTYKMLGADVRREYRRADREPAHAAPAEEKILLRLDLVALQRECDHSRKYGEVAEYHKPVKQCHCRYSFF